MISKWCNGERAITNNTLNIIKKKINLSKGEAERLDEINKICKVNLSSQRLIKKRKKSIYLLNSNLYGDVNNNPAFSYEDRLDFGFWDEDPVSNDDKQNIFLVPIIGTKLVLSSDFNAPDLKPFCSHIYWNLPVTYVKFIDENSELISLNIKAGDLVGIVQESHKVNINPYRWKSPLYYIEIKLNNKWYQRIYKVVGLKSIDGKTIEEHNLIDKGITEFKVSETEDSAPIYLSSNEIKILGWVANKSTKIFS